MRRERCLLVANNRPGTSDRVYQSQRNHTAVITRRKSQFRTTDARVTFESPPPLSQSLPLPHVLLSSRSWMGTFIRVVWSPQSSQPVTGNDALLLLDGSSAVVRGNNSIIITRRRKAALEAEEENHQSRPFHSIPPPLATSLEWLICVWNNFSVSKSLSFLFSFLISTSAVSHSELWVELLIK